MKSRYLLRWLWLSLTVIGLDQLSKWAAVTFLPYDRAVPILPHFNLTLVYNTGAAFNFLSHADGWQRWFFVGLAFLVSIALIVWLKRLREGSHWTALAIALILGGSLGNATDRIVRSHVVDFISLYIQHWYWPAFNLADSAITVGAFTLILRALFNRERNARQQK